MVPALLKNLAWTCALVCLLTTSARAETLLLRVEGSTTMQPLLQQLMAAYERKQRGVRFELAGGGSSAGIEALLSGRVQLAASSRFITPEELARAQAGGVYPVPFRVAYDAIIPVVNTRNPVKNLELAELGRIFRGEVRDWSEVGGTPGPIRVVARAQGSGTSQVWRERVAGGAPPAAGATLVTSAAAVLQAVGREPGAIGYIGLGNLNASVKPLRVGGVMGSLANVRANRYALARPLFLFANGWPEGEVMRFIDFVLDPATGQQVAASAGFVPLSPGERR